MFEEDDADFDFEFREDSSSWDVQNGRLSDSNRARKRPSNSPPEDGFNRKRSPSEPQAASALKPTNNFRRLPGPAGLIAGGGGGKSSGGLSSPPNFLANRNRIIRHHDQSGEKEGKEESKLINGYFESAAWKQMLKERQIENDQHPDSLTAKYSVDWIRKKSRDFDSNPSNSKLILVKIPFFVAVIEKVDLKNVSEDKTVGLVDRNGGKVSAVFHKSLVENYPTFIQPGVVVVLRDIQVLNGVYESHLMVNLVQMVGFYKGNDENEGGPKMSVLAERICHISNRDIEMEAKRLEAIEKRRKKALLERNSHEIGTNASPVIPTFQGIGGGRTASSQFNSPSIASTLSLNSNQSEIIMRNRMNVSGFENSPSAVATVNSGHVASTHQSSAAIANSKNNSAVGPGGGGQPVKVSFEFEAEEEDDDDFFESIPLPGASEEMPLARNTKIVIEEAAPSNVSSSRFKFKSKTAAREEKADKVQTENCSANSNTQETQELLEGLDDDSLFGDF